jgi:hypothetical protein
MQNEFDMGTAGSLTVAILCLSVALLLRNFYKRYKRLEARKEETDSTN